MGNVGLSEVVVIFVVVLLVIGPKRLPEVGRALGEAIRAFQDSLRGKSSDPSHSSTHDEPPDQTS